MKRHDLGTLYLTQKSLTEWLEDIKHDQVKELRHEDNEKRERLRVLSDISGLPFDRPVQFSAADVANNSPEHQKYLLDHGDEMCALRLIPNNDPTLPKLRLRGKSVQGVQAWFHEQKVDASKYRAEYVPHCDDQEWSTIFVINNKGIFGEIIRGRHSQLTQGLHEDDNLPITFSYDFSAWHAQPRDDEALSAIQRIVAHLKLSDEHQQMVMQQLGGSFAKSYLKGYFETTESPEFGLWFIDYAPKMAELIGDIAPLVSRNDGSTISGQIGCKGRVTGVVRIVTTNGKDDGFPDGAVLVCSMTTPDLVPLMQKASAIVTDQGGILSHAAIVARELGKPCIVGTQDATALLQDGDRVVVDADSGIVTKLNI